MAKIKDLITEIEGLKAELDQAKSEAATLRIALHDAQVALAARTAPRVAAPKHSTVSTYRESLDRARELAMRTGRVVRVAV